MPRILVVEDNADLAFGLRNNLAIEGYEVDLAGDGAEALETAARAAPDLVILDLMLPGIDGYAVLRRLRQDGDALPILVLTARSEEADRILAFRFGADDYVTKPFSLMELILRVKALLRRAPARTDAARMGPASARIRIGQLELDVDSRMATRSGTAVKIPPKQLDLLLALIRRKGRPASRLELLQEVWGHRGAVLTRTVDYHVAELRKKLEPDPSNPRHILTVSKTGYRVELE